MEHFRQIKMNIMPRQNINGRLWNHQSLHSNLGTYGDTFTQKAKFKVETALVQWARQELMALMTRNASSGFFHGSLFHWETLDR